MHMVLSELSSCQSGLCTKYKQAAKDERIMYTIYLYAVLNKVAANFFIKKTEEKKFEMIKMSQFTRQGSVLLLITIIGMGLLLVYSGSSSKNRLSLNLEDETPNFADKLYKMQELVPVSMEQITSGTPIILAQDDKRLLEYIWSREYIIPPSTNEYKLTSQTIDGEDPSRGQGQFIRKLFKNMTNGFFVECGALDGETRSNSLYMEMHLGWKGLLVEGDPSNFALLKRKNRKAWASNTCLVVKPYPHTVNFLQHFNVGKILNSEATSTEATSSYVKVQCMPLFSLLAAINVTTVDYFSLDVEGSELQVLKTIPFDKVHIKTLSVEYIHTAEGKEETIKFMASKNYRVVGEVHYPKNLANDLMFAYEDVKVNDDKEDKIWLVLSGLSWRIPFKHVL